MGPVDGYEIAHGHFVEEWSVLVVCCPGPQQDAHWKGSLKLFFPRWRLRRDLRNHLRDCGVQS